MILGRLGARCPFSSPSWALFQRVAVLVGRGAMNQSRTMAASPPQEGEYTRLDSFSGSGAGIEVDVDVDTYGSADSGQGGASSTAYSSLVNEEIQSLESTLKGKNVLLEEKQTRLLKVLARKANFEEEISELKREYNLLEDNIRKLQHDYDKDPPPGPASLLWVEGNVFTLFAMSIIIANLISMAVEMIHDTEFYWLDQVFLVFYTIELTLKAVLHQRQLMIGPLRIVWWNWLDTLIVVSGIFDSWVCPLVLGSTKSMAIGGIPVSQYLRFLRLARLARVLRILKVVRILLFSDVSWAEGEKFQLFIMSVIGLSCILMGAESDYKDFAGWPYIEQIVMVIFLFELLVKIRLHGLISFFFQDSNFAWNWLDFIIVGSGVVEMWAMPIMTLIVGRHHKSGLMEHMKMLRMLRLMRVLRLVRLIKNIPPLFTLLMGIAQAMAGMMWVMLLTVMVLYAASLVAVKLLRDGLAYGEIGPPASVVENFGSMWDSMFALFQVMNGDASPLEDVFTSLPASKGFYMLFVVGCNWAILAILTAVVSDNMIKVTEEVSMEQEYEIKVRLNNTRRKVFAEVFDHMDISSDGLVSEEEFHNVFKDQDKRMELCDALQMDPDEVVEIFDLMPRMKCGGVDRDAFIYALERDAHVVNMRCFMGLEQRLHKVEENMRQFMTLVKDWREDDRRKKNLLLGGYYQLPTEVLQKLPQEVYREVQQGKPAI
jgi:voltage-gated sodium channel